MTNVEVERMIDIELLARCRCVVSGLYMGNWSKGNFR